MLRAGLRFVLSIMIGIVIIYGLARAEYAVFGPITCRDGWPSPSIGRRGACSWHGGVSHGRDVLSLIYVALGISAGVGFFRSRVAGRIGGD